MQQDLMKKTAIACLLFFAVAMGVILYMSANRVIIIADVAQDEVEENVPAEQAQEIESEKALTFILGEAYSSYLCIPLPEDCKADKIVIENHYMDKELWITVAGAEEDFYGVNAVSGNREMITEGIYERAENGVKIRFRLTGIYEYRTILENNSLYISFLSPREMYDKIVVIDPACGGLNAGYTVEGMNEKEINLQIARKLKEKLDSGSIKAYYTRMDDVNPGEEERVYLANETKADMYIRIQVNADEDAGIYGAQAVYNGDYFIPGFGSIELADRLEREVVTSIRGKALGLAEAGTEEYAIRHITIPAAAIQVGYITNKQERTLLEKEEYIDKIAAGIYNAILAAYEENGQ